MKLVWRKHVCIILVILISILFGGILGIISQDKANSSNPYVYNGEVSNKEWVNVFVSQNIIFSEQAKIVCHVDNKESCDIRVIDFSSNIIDNFTLTPGQKKEVKIENVNSYYIQCKTDKSVKQYRISVLIENNNIFDIIADTFLYLFWW